MDKLTQTPALAAHAAWGGKIEVVSRAEINNAAELAVAYTPGVAEPCLEIAKNPEAAWIYTRKHNLVAVISDGSAVLGLGNIGGAAGMPVMEGKCALFKRFADVDAFPLVLNTQDVDEVVATVSAISPSFGGINLEDIAAPRCFEIEDRLKESLDIPVFHDDQHGTAVVCCAALLNAAKLVGKNMNELKVVMSGAGAAGVAIAKLMRTFGIQDIVVCDRSGAIYEGREGLNPTKERLAKITNLEKRPGTLAEHIVGADVFVGVSAPGLLTQEMVKSMNQDAIVFAMANPTPEIMPDEAAAAGAAVVATGRSDFANQINNVLAFPGIFRGALDVRASTINEEMKVAATKAIADLISADELSADNVIPSAFDERVAPAVAQAVAEAAKATGVARI